MTKTRPYSFHTSVISGFTLALLIAPSVTAQNSAPAAPACADANFHAFDFWVGEWNAYVNGTDQLAGLSSIKAEDGGCVITEHWQSQRSSFSGRSVNSYDSVSGKWRQFWSDSSGSSLFFIGEPTANGMMLTADTGKDGADRYSRMEFSHNGDGSVRQHGTASADGVTWTERYDFIYRPRAP